MSILNRQFLPKARKHVYLPSCWNYLPLLNWVSIQPTVSWLACSCDGAENDEVHWDCLFPGLCLAARPTSPAAAALMGALHPPGHAAVLQCSCLMQGKSAYIYYFWSAPMLLACLIPCTAGYCSSRADCARRAWGSTSAAAALLPLPCLLPRLTPSPGCYQAPSSTFCWMHPAGQMVHPFPAPTQLWWVSGRRRETAPFPTTCLASSHVSCTCLPARSGQAAGEAMAGEHLQVR